MIGGFSGVPLSRQCSKLCSGHKTPFLKKDTFCSTLILQVFANNSEECEPGRLCKPTQKELKLKKK